MKKSLLSLLIVGLCWVPASHAANGIAIEAGRGDDSTDVGQISLIRQWDDKWFTDGNWYITGYWEASVGHWHSSDAGGKGIWDIGLAPIFRLQSKATSGIRPYAEGAIGVRFIDHTHVNDKRDMGIAFQFGDHLGVGMVFGDRGKFDLGYRFLHVSNADIKKPNNGINIQKIRFAYLF